MENNNATEKDKDCECTSKHLGSNVRHLREMLCIKQQTLAEKMGVTQQTISKIESKEEIDKKTLEKIAKALEVPVSLIENFNLDEVIYNIQNNYDSSKGYVRSEDKSHIENITNSIDLIKFSFLENKNLYESIINNLKEENKALKQEIGVLRNKKG